MPGESYINKKNLSFYVLNRKSSAEMVNIYMFADKEFDKDGLFLSPDEIGFSNIYYDDSNTFIEYDNESVKEIKIY